MTLDERIAKRKADGWEVACWVVKGSFDSGLYLDARGMCWGSRPYAGRFPSKEAAESTARIGDETKCCATPVFARTIRTKRGHSFSWALARMKEGCWVRRRSWNESYKIRFSVGELQDVNGLEPDVLSEDLLATNWELAE